MGRGSLASILVSAVLMGCSGSGPLRDFPIFLGAAEKQLAAGIRSYEDGNYREATQLLQSSLDTGLSARYDQVNAHKYLAFVHCISNRERQCRDEFRKALELNPSFDLDSSEAGHPTWGPVFRSVKPRK